MKSPVRILAGRFTTGQIQVHWVCSLCKAEGEWTASLEDAERGGRQHRRDAHPRAVTA